MTEGIPVDVLEKQAADQRRQLHHSVVELRHSVQEKLDVKRNVRNHLGRNSGGNGSGGPGPGIYGHRHLHP